jgi:formylglycine-generating enzyme required for sulfatase activity
MAGAGDQAKPISLFYSYSHRDEELRDRLEEHLGVLRRRGLIEGWHDRRISAGTEWKDAIDEHLATADIILLLISSGFINSDYCWDKEMTKALERHAKGEARVIPVVLKPCYWQESLFAKLQMVPRDAKPITSWADPDEAFVQVVEAIHRAVNEIRLLRSRATPPPSVPEPAVENRPAIIREPTAPKTHVRSTRHALTAGASAAGSIEELHEYRRRIIHALKARASAAGPAEVNHPGPTVLEPLAVFSDIDAPWCPEMVALPAGEFLMGSPNSDKDADDREKPQHRVTLGYRFAIGRYPVTFDEYDHFCRATSREKPADGGWGRGRRPAISVSWEDAKAYCAWLSEETGQSYRLPSEAEWEYACRAGTTTRYSCGDTIAEKDANFAPSALRSLVRGLFGEGKTSVVGSYPPNPWGLHDMHGNVWEWVEDYFHDHYKGAPEDGSAWLSGDDSSRVLRGGSWLEEPNVVRSAHRGPGRPVTRFNTLGFRIARTID